MIGVSFRARVKRLFTPVIRHKTVRYRDFRVRGSFADYGVLTKLARGEREVLMTRTFDSVVAPGATVVDVGAHLGQYVLQAARRVGPNGRVFAFEPHPRTVTYLRENVRANGFEKVVTVVAAAVSETSAMLSFHADRLQSDFSSTVRVRDRASSQTVMVAAGPLSMLAPGVTPDVLKVDVEGAEIDVLRGSQSALERARLAGKRPRLFVESNASALQAAGVGPLDLLECIASCGFQRIDVIDEGLGKLRPFVDADERGCVNLFCE